MSLEDNKAIVRRFYEELLHTGNPELVDELFAPDYTQHYSGHPEPISREDFKQLVTLFAHAFPLPQVIVQDMIAEADKVTARFIWHGTHSGEFRSIAPTGKPVTMTGIHIFRLIEGKIVEQWVEEDQQGFQQLSDTDS